jgi:hypothetical protein
MLCRRLDEIASAWRAATAEPPIVSVNNPNPSARLTHDIRASHRGSAHRATARDATMRQTHSCSHPAWICNLIVHCTPGERMSRPEKPRCRETNAMKGKCARGERA